jgi:hypothetical protein
MTTKRDEVVREIVQVARRIGAQGERGDIDLRDEARLAELIARLPFNSSCPGLPAPKPEGEAVAWQYRDGLGQWQHISEHNYHAAVRQGGYETRKLYTHPAPTPVVTEEWRPEDDRMPGTWRGACGALWTFTDAGPVENEMHYCPQCGKGVVLVQP